MCKMTVRMEQLLCIAEATNSKVYTQELNAEAHGWVKALVLPLKQYHTHYYWLYKNEQLGPWSHLQGLHLGNASRCSNITSSVGLKFVCPWGFKLGENTEMIATHLWEVHYRLVIACDLCKSFTSMSVKMFWNTTQGVRPSMLKNVQNKKGMKRWEGGSGRSPRQGNRKKHPNHWIGQHWRVSMGKMMPNTYCLILQMNTGWFTPQFLLSHSDHVFWMSFHSIAQSVCFCFN